MVENSPLVSVIVPAWNAERTLLETLQSAAAQTYSNLEIVIVDDGSTDRTAAIAGEFCAGEPRARLVRQVNRGLSAARNRGVAESRGAWLAPLDADDVWHPTAIEKLVRAALACPRPPGFVYCWYRTIDEHGYILSSGPRIGFAGPSMKRLTYHNTIHTVLLSRRAVESVGGYDTRLSACEDAMIQLQIARAYPIAVVPEHLMGYRWRADSMSRQTDLVIRSWKTVHDRLVAEGADIPPRVIRWMDAFFFRILAEHRVNSGFTGQGLLLLVRALWRDPVRWFPYLLYRTTRTSVRLIRGRRPRPRQLHFNEVDPRAATLDDPDDLALFARMVRKIELARLRRLAAIETLTEPSKDRGKRPVDPICGARSAEFLAD